MHERCLKFVRKLYLPERCWKFLRKLYLPERCWKFLRKLYLPERCWISYIFSVSLERSGRAFDEKEIALLNEVRNLRQRLALENRNKRPPPVLCE